MARHTHNNVDNVSTGTEVRFTADPTPIKSLLVHANAANTNNIVVGLSSVTVSNSPPIKPDGTFTFNFREYEDELPGDLADFWMDAVVSGEGLTFMAIKQ